MKDIIARMKRLQLRRDAGRLPCNRSSMAVESLSRRRCNRCMSDVTATHNAVLLYTITSSLEPQWAGFATVWALFLLFHSCPTKPVLLALRVCLQMQTTAAAKPLPRPVTHPTAKTAVGLQTGAGTVVCCQQESVVDSTG